MAKEKPAKKNLEKPLVRLKRSLTIDNLWLYILSLLTEKDMHAYAMLDEIKKRYGWKPGLVTPYVVLYKLEEEGHIRGYNRKRRRYYGITKKGKEILATGKKELIRLAKVL